MSKFKALSFAGQESIESIEKAYKLDPQNIQAVVDRANAFVPYSAGLLVAIKKL